jgi:transcriptional regulator with XRE-family HTH domain
MFKLRDFRKEQGLTQIYVAQLFGCVQSNIVAIEKEGKNLTEEQVDILNDKYGKDYVAKFIELDSLGEVQREEKSDVQFYDPENLPVNKKLIPLYDDVSSVGGKLAKGYSANITSNSPPAEWIDPGDWFNSATAAIRNYGDSMVEYPAGCILALKEVQDRQLIVPGRDYVIETSEYRLTKKIQLANNPDYLRVHSTNTEKYDDGTLVHQPFNIKWNLIVRIYEVLGYVVKKGGGTMVYTNNK